MFLRSTRTDWEGTGTVWEALGGLWASLTYIRGWGGWQIWGMGQIWGCLWCTGDVGGCQGFFEGCQGFFGGTGGVLGCGGTWVLTVPPRQPVRVLGGLRGGGRGLRRAAGG